MVDPERSCALEKPVHRRAVELSGTSSQTIGFGHARQELEVHLLCEPTERAVANLVPHLVPGSRLEMLGDDAEDLPAHVVAIHRPGIEAIEERFGGRYAALLMIHRSDPAVDDR